MKLYLSFGYVDEEGKSTRLFHLEEPVDLGFLKDLIGKVTGLI